MQDPAGHIVLKPGTGGKYHTSGALKPGSMLGNLLNIVPELKSFACLDLKVVFNLGEGLQRVCQHAMNQLPRSLAHPRDPVLQTAAM